MFARSRLRRGLGMWVGAVAVASCLAAPAAAQPGPARVVGHGSVRSDMHPKAGEPASTREFKAADTTMMRAMQVGYTGDPDVDFRTHMIPHHQGAVAMARVALQHATDPDTKAMAQKIIDDQEREIADMQRWLEAHRR